MRLTFAAARVVLPRHRLRQVEYCNCRWKCTAGNVDEKRIVFLGTPDVAAESLTQLIVNAPSVNGRIVSVVTRPPARKGRSRTLSPSPVHATADEHGISVLTPRTAKDDTFLDTLAALKPDLCITAAYGCILPQRFIDLPRHGTLNIHPSLLPRWRGAAPVPRALEAGDSETGVSVAFTQLALDAGPVLVQRRVAPGQNETAPELLARLFALGTEALLESLPSVWDGTAVAQPQNNSAATHAPKLSKEEARLTFVENACIVHNKVRAFAGWPGTWADFAVGEDMTELRLKVIRTSVLREQGGMCLGVHDVKFSDELQCLRVTCDDGSVIGIHEVQPAGKKAMSARAFWNGLRTDHFIRKRVPH